jgi:hypothetical protein
VFDPADAHGDQWFYSLTMKPVARQGKKQQLQVNAKANPINIGV